MSEKIEIIMCETESIMIPSNSTIERLKRVKKELYKIPVTFCKENDEIMAGYEREELNDALEQAIFILESCLRTSENTDKRHKRELQIYVDPKELKHYRRIRGKIGVCTCCNAHVAMTPYCPNCGCEMDVLNNELSKVQLSDLEVWNYCPWCGREETV